MTPRSTSIDARARVLLLMGASNCYPTIQSRSPPTIFQLWSVPTVPWTRLAIFEPIVAVGGYGRTTAWSINGRSTAPLEHDTNNDGWFDDTSDGPVTATLIFTDGSHQGVQGNAWLVATAPGYAPQVFNSVSLWGDIFDNWVRHLALKPTLFREGAFQEDYKPSYAETVEPIGDLQYDAKVVAGTAAQRPE